MTLNLQGRQYAIEKLFDHIWEEEEYKWGYLGKG